jgi:uncharacterized protein with HEPN domain
MQLEAKKYLYDIADAGEPTAAFTSGKTFADYKGDAMLRSAVERKFEITGEALAQLSRLDESVAAQITEYRRIVAFRNILVHRYAQVDDRLVWDIVETKLPALRREVATLLKE